MIRQFNKLMGFKLIDLKINELKQRSIYILKSLLQNWVFFLVSVILCYWWCGLTHRAEMTTAGNEACSLPSAFLYTSHIFRSISCLYGKRAKKKSCPDSHLAGWEYTQYRKTNQIADIARLLWKSVVTNKPRLSNLCVRTHVLANKSTCQSYTLPCRPEMYWSLPVSHQHWVSNEAISCSLYR